MIEAVSIVEISDALGEPLLDSISLLDLREENRIAIRREVPGIKLNDDIQPLNSRKRLHLRTTLCLQLAPVRIRGNNCKSAVLSSILTTAKQM